MCNQDSVQVNPWRQIANPARQDEHRNWYPTDAKNGESFETRFQYFNLAT